MGDIPIADWKHRTSEAARDALSRFCTRKASVMTVPVDNERDADCILSDVISERDSLLGAQGSIGWAVAAMIGGKKVRRAGWNGKGMWLKLCNPDEYSEMGQPYVYMSPVDGKLIPWLCSQADLLATDWEAAD